MPKTNSLKAGGISIHAVDIARGVPAAGLRVRLHRVDGDCRVGVNIRSVIDCWNKPTAPIRANIPIARRPPGPRLLVLIRRRRV